MYQYLIHQILRALTNSQLELTKRIERLEARLADLEIDFTDPTVNCKRRKKLRFNKRNIQYRLYTERCNLVAVTNALAETDFRLQSNQQSAIFTVCQPQFFGFLTDTPTSSPPLMPFSISPTSSLLGHSSFSPLSPVFSPGHQISHSPQHLVEEHDIGSTSIPEYPSIASVMMPNQWLHSPVQECDYIGLSHPIPNRPSSAHLHQPTSDDITDIHEQPSSIISSYISDEHDEADEDELETMTHKGPPRKEEKQYKDDIHERELGIDSRLWFEQSQCDRVGNPRFARHSI